MHWCLTKPTIHKQNSFRSSSRRCDLEGRASIYVVPELLACWPKEQDQECIQLIIVSGCIPLQPKLSKCLATHEQTLSDVRQTETMYVNSFWLSTYLKTVQPLTYVWVLCCTNCRVILEPVDEGRLRLDAGTWGTMGVGLGYAIAAAAVRPDRLVVDIEGDSAFGFSGMEIETMVR